MLYFSVRVSLLLPYINSQWIELMYHLDGYIIVYVCVCKTKKQQM